MKKTLDKVTTEGRSELYGFFSRIYRQEIDKALLVSLKNGLSTLDVDDAQLAEHYTALREFLGSVTINQEFIDDLAADYADVFLGIGKKPAHPYESVYRDADHIVMREPRNQVLKVYNAAGVQKVDDFKEPEDHVSLEFEFMAYLCHKTGEALDGADKKTAVGLIKQQQDFLEKHLLSWVPDFCRDVENSFAKYDFYRIMARITRRVLEIEKETLDKLVKTTNK